MTKHLVDTAITALSDWKDRHLGGEAASVSFYAIFSVFPLLAFSVYLVGTLSGNGDHSAAAKLVLAMLRDFVPGMQNWIEKGLFDAIKGSAATSWVNGALLAWSGLGFFGAVLSAVERLPENAHDEHRAHLTQFVLAAVTLALFGAFLSTLVFCEMAGKSARIPAWLQELPFEVQDALYFGARTRVLLGVVSVAIVATLYKLLLPVKLRIRSAVIGALVFTGLLLASRSVYWIYLHYNKHSIESTYGIFSALILIMLWVHFCVSCLLYGCLYALHLDKAAAHGGVDAGRHEGGGHGDGHGGDHGHAAGDPHGQQKQAA
ncbi:MAG: YihY/virulence factor BrkB family protein [Deltaproteobacteria bacterium]|nr:YihY/virulence factor BrkB family protein [Deltaproteobacteria bacterium]